VVIAERFAWAHLPKAAGTATQAMFTAVPDLVLFQAPIDSNDKHDAFWVHEEAIEGKLRAMNIRRLPSWVLSTAHHKAVSGVWPEFEPLPMPSVDEMVESREPDDVLRWMTDGPRFSVDHWLRAESLDDDVEALLLEIGTPPSVAREAVGSVPFVGKPYDHNVASTFSADQIRRMYERNPGWAEAERVAYGEIHELALA
jgi:hypothetical protein